MAAGDVVCYANASGVRIDGTTCLQVVGLRKGLSMGLLKELWKRMVKGSDDPAWSVLRERSDFWMCLNKAHELVKGGAILPEAHGEAVAYSAWGSLNAADRERTLALAAPSMDVDALAKWFYDHREEEQCWWRTRYRRGEPYIKMDPFGRSKGCDIDQGVGGRWIANVKGARCVDRLQRAASRKYAELVLGWKDDPAREKYLRLMGVSGNDENGR